MKLHELSDWDQRYEARDSGGRLIACVLTNASGNLPKAYIAHVSKSYGQTWGCFDDCRRLITKTRYYYAQQNTMTGGVSSWYDDRPTKRTDDWRILRCTDVMDPSTWEVVGDE